MVLALVATAPDEDALAYVGAGPLEDLVKAHGDELVDELESEARQDPRFDAALRGVWLSTGTLQEGVQSRLSAWVTLLP